MMKPEITIHDAITGETEVREMTDEEYAELLASGWTESTEETPTE
jgi:hypothetical protein